MSTTTAVIQIEAKITDLHTLCQNHLRAKEELRLKQLELDAINAQIAEHFNTTMEGSKAYRLNEYNITVETRINRKIDVQKLEMCNNMVPEGVQLLKPALNESAWKQFKKKYNDLAEAIISLGAVEENYGKVGVRISL